MRSVTYYKEEIIEGGGKEWVKIDLDKGLAEAAYKDYVNRNIRNFDIRVEFGITTLTASDIASIKINSDLFSGDTFTIGSAVAETLDLTIFKSYDEINKSRPIIPYVSLYTQVEIDHVLTPIKQEVCMGIFYINPDGVTEEGLSSTSIRASSVFSNPKYGGKTFEVSDPSASFNRSLTDIINNICSDINNDTNFSPNIELNTALPSINITNADSIVGKTYSEIINHIAKLYGGYARTIYDEKANRIYLEFFRFQETDYFYDKSNYMSYKRSDEFLTITKIECKCSKKNEEGEEEETTIIAGSGDANHTVQMECADMTEDRLNEILAEYMGKYKTFHPITSKIFGSPVLEVGDIASIRGRGTRAEGAAMPLHSITYNITGNGLTMDIKSSFKASTNMTIKSYIKEMNKAKEDMTGDLQDIRDRQTELENKHTEDKGALESSIQDIDNKLTELEDDLDNIMTTIGGSVSTTGGITFIDKSGNKVGYIAPDENNRASYVDDIDLVDMYSEYECGVSLGRKTSAGTNSGYKRDIIISNGDFAHDGVAYYDGVNIIDPYIIGSTNFAGWIRLDKNEGKYVGYGRLAPLEDQGFRIYGQYSLHLSVYPDGTNKPMLSFMKGTNNTYEAFLHADLNGCNNVIYNAFYEAGISPQSTYTSSLIENGTNENMIYGGHNYDSGEVRWCWKETVFTYPEADIDPETDEWVYTGRYLCYVELPIFMAENIQNDYHINISKMSWGDYRIIEKNPYYFILESEKEDFAFTFEIVAKLNDNQTLNNNTIIANSGFDIPEEVTIDANEG